MALKTHFVDSLYPKVTVCGYTIASAVCIGRYAHLAGQDGVSTVRRRITEDLHLVTCKRCKAVIILHNYPDQTLDKENLDNLWQLFLYARKHPDELVSNEEASPMNDVFFVALCREHGNGIITVVTKAKDEDDASDRARNYVHVLLGENMSVLHAFRYEGGTMCVSRYDTVSSLDDAKK